MCVFTAQVTSQFVAENEAMRSTVEKLKGVLEAIDGERFQEVSDKLVALDASQSGHIQMLAFMLKAESETLRAESRKHDQALHEPYQRLQAAEVALSNSPRPETGSSGSRLGVPDPSGWTLDVLNGRDGGSALCRESFDLQAGSIWAGIEKVLEHLRESKTVINRSAYEFCCRESLLNPVGDCDYLTVGRKI